jgi:hypothetical protein
VHTFFLSSNLRYCPESLGHWANDL